MFEYVETVPGRWEWQFVAFGAVAARSGQTYESRGQAAAAALAWSREVDRAGKAMRAA